MSPGEADGGARRPGLSPGGRGAEVRLEAPAKVNLYLDILGRREDGFHEIDTVMQAVDLADALVLRAREDGELTLVVTGLAAGVPADQTNLVMKAARALVGHLRGSGGALAGPLGADIELRKRVPPGSGLGGGSSDAAAALAGLARLWGARPSREELTRLAAGLGSDVPFFVLGGTARCRGRGEVVEPVGSRGALHAALVFSEPLSTREAYAAFDRLPPETRAAGPGLPLDRDGALDLGAVGRVPLWNSLEAAAFEVRPALRETKAALLAAGQAFGVKTAALSGSGSAIFGLFDSRGDAERAAERLRADGRDAVAVSSIRAGDA